MNTELPEQVLVFTIEGERFALPLASVERVVRAVAVTPLPDAPSKVAGVINVHGDLLPVVNMRLRLGLPEREIDPADQFILAKMDRLTVAIVADHVDGIILLPIGAAVNVEGVMGEFGIIDGILKVTGGLILLQNLQRFFALDERRSLDEALSCCESASDNSPADAVP
jgi:purine-binding chemotaxis protein CheW